ncbi:MAG: SagB/ThcOx family dehydrogenase [Candidatus Margulisbacteria bacterium]|nr:SagB/ThcOx family dehydrogenase [Candidatus Margulisiibacteriota bacterium]
MFTFKQLLVAALILELAGGIALAAEKINKEIKLPEPKILGKMTVEESIFRRRSERSFLPNALTLEQISQLLWSAQGITDKTWGFRAAPSSGSLFPLTLYVAKSDGVFKYVPDGHKLVQTAAEDVRPSLVRASLGQAFIGEAPLVIIIAGNFRIVEAKYGQRSYRYLNMEIGHAAENIELQAVALGLVSVPVGAFWDDVIGSTLNLPDTQDPFYIIPVGYYKPGS